LAQPVRDPSAGQKGTQAAGVVPGRMKREETPSGEGISADSLWENSIGTRYLDRRNFVRLGDDPG
jgi:hypothetical protein